MLSVLQENEGLIGMGLVFFQTDSFQETSREKKTLKAM